MYDMMFVAYVIITNIEHILHNTILIYAHIGAGFERLVQWTCVAVDVCIVVVLLSCRERV